MPPDTAGKDARRYRSVPPNVPVSSSVRVGVGSDLTLALPQPDGCWHGSNRSRTFYEAAPPRCHQRARKSRQGFGRGLEKGSHILFDKVAQRVPPARV